MRRAQLASLPEPNLKEGIVVVMYLQSLSASFSQNEAQRLITRPSRGLHTENGIDASVVLRIVCDLGVFTPYNFARIGHEPKLRDINLNDSPARYDTELGEHLAAWILLDADNVQAEGGLELRVSNVGLLKAQAHRANKALIFGGLSGEALANIGDLGNHAFPLLFLTLARLNNLEHLVLGNGPDLWERDVPLARLFLALLLEGVAEDLGAGLLGAVEEVGRDGAVAHGLVGNALLVVLEVHVDGLLHGGLLLEALLVVQLCLDARERAGLLRAAAHGARLALADALMVVQAHAVALPVQFNVLALRHFGRERRPRHKLSCGG